MHKGARRLMTVLAAATAVLAMGAAPALARPADAPAPVASAGTLSDVTTQAWEDWINGSCLVGEGAAQLVSGAYVGAPSIALDLLKGEGLTDPSELAWLTFNEGGGKLTQGAGQMVAAAFFGVPFAALDYAKAAIDAGAEGGEWKTWDELTPAEHEQIGYECGYVF